jgi:hypothetical protein
MKKIEIKNQVQVLESKYFDLVWYSRSSPKNDHIKGVLENRKRIQESYPTEVLDLGGVEGQWHHGFNSGCLAGLRFALDLADGGVEYATSEFPSLDT